MARGLAVGVWLLSMVAMYLFMVWGQRYKQYLESLGAPVSRRDLALITMADLVVNYWYIVAGLLLLLCLSIPGGKRSPEQRQGD